MTAGPSAPVPGIAPVQAAAKASPYARALPHVRVGTISGLLELIVETGELRLEIARLSERLALPVDDLLAILDAAVLLGFATVADGVVHAHRARARLSRPRRFCASKDLFRQQVLAHAPIIATIVKTLSEKANKTMRADFFLDLLDEHYPAEEARPPVPDRRRVGPLRRALRVRRRGGAALGLRHAHLRPGRRGRDARLAQRRQRCQTGTQPSLRLSRANATSRPTSAAATATSAAMRYASGTRG